MKSVSSLSTEVESLVSWAAIISIIVAQSVTSLQRGPIWSKDEPYAISPYLDTVPYVGFMPTTPQYEAGCLIEPPVSEPSAAKHSFAATAAAEPPEEPPGTCSVFLGFLVGP